MEPGDEPGAVMIHDAWRDDERDLVRAVGSAAAMALENERLAADLSGKVDELSASRARIVESADAARRRLERDLHDGAQQRLVSLALSLRILRSRLDGDGEEAAELEYARGELDLALAELRELARGLHPSVLSDRGLPAALGSLARSRSTAGRVRGERRRAAAGSGRVGGLLRGGGGADECGQVRPGNPRKRQL